MQIRLHWSTVVGAFVDTRDLHVVKNGDRWQVDWPLVKEPVVPPQVIPVNYLRWDVIYRGAGDDWGVQDVEAPHVRVVDMHPVQRAEGVVILGELLNEDVVPAYVSVGATLLSKRGTAIASEDTFDKISHILLPKQVTPFLVNFPNATLSDVGSIRLDPVSALVPASADPVIEIENQRLNPAPDASLTGELTNQSGQVVNVAHVLTTFYDKTGQIVWIADEYIDRACYLRLLLHSMFIFLKILQKISAVNAPLLHLTARGRFSDDQTCRSAHHSRSRGNQFAYSQSDALGIPASVTAGESFAIQNPSGGNATVYIVGPSQVVRRDVQGNGVTSLPAGSLFKAGHYMAILVHGSLIETQSFDVVPAAQPANLSFLARPSRLSVNLHNGITGAVYIFDSYRNLVMSPLPVSFHSPTHQALHSSVL